MMICRRHRFFIVLARRMMRPLSWIECASGRRNDSNDSRAV
ncbi:hypothetical protein BURMUCGD2M_1640 [Burkholderia multivorans CGD2M]|uniref:Uncharacterized protein n=1 Tax=Burkholderia multivorans CGD2 TaxID=513052 RepID=B9C006_9BURK|nr:hypothetical protein BURMUCGD2_1545 [Burkholderia multivorans CGD2]EEE14707.1 hypothetical protein BURMUCGD2M_1640 [Burkholderia multivorans CGD2M]